MAFIEAPTNFYLGKTFNPQTNKLADDVVYYDSRDLTTHAVVVGMTGSGKTGLCITMLEEAILDNIPAIIIDPKGDIVNLLLTFPNLQPQDFAPWIHADDARRANMDEATYATDVARRWRDGLQSWGIVPDRINWMKLASQISVYTPGSDAGLPISILASLRAPRIDWNVEAESTRERISGIVTALFALAGMSFQPVKDVEHVLLSTIMEYNWRQMRDLTLEDIVLQIQRPPFEKLGVFPVEQAMTEKKRYKLAMELNNIIAAPSFQSWLVGEPLDIHRLLRQPNGRPRVSVFYIAHLNDQERMFIITLLLESLIAWMRMERGTPSLRALLYIDEMFGYFPPYPKNPPTKEPLMRLLKQARAFGLGLILATQNPGDLDYKGLTNAGTWFIGRLQSDNDRAKVMDGLRSLATAQDAMDLRDVEALVAGIQPRVFLMRNVHTSGAPVLVHTRWTMSYLAGPLTRQQIGYLMQPQRQELIARLAQQQAQQHYTQPLQPQSFAQQSGYPTGYGAPPPPPMSGFNAAPPPPPGFSATPPPPPGFNAAPPPPPGFSQQPNYGGYTAPMPPPPMTGFGAQSAPVYSNPGTGSMPPVSDPGMTQAMRMPGGLMQQKPPVSSAIREYFLPTTLTADQALAQYAQQTGQRIGGGGSLTMAYKPVLLAQSAVRYQQKTSGIYTTREYAFHIPDLQTQGLIHWEQFQASVIDARQISSSAFAQAVYQELPLGLVDEKRLAALQKELVDFMYNTARLIIPYHAVFKIAGNPDRDMSEFQAQVYQIAREKRDAELDKVAKQYGGLMDKLEEKLTKKQRELDAEKLEVGDRKREQMFTAGEAVLSIFKGYTNYTLSRMSRASLMKRQAEADLKESRQVIGEVEQQMIALEEEFEGKLREINDRWVQIANQIEEQTITAYKKDIHVEVFGVGWIPHYYLNVGGSPLLIPGFV